MWRQIIAAGSLYGAKTKKKNRARITARNRIMNIVASGLATGSHVHPDLIAYVRESSELSLTKALAASNPREQRERKIDKFYSSQEWRKVRYQALLKHGGKCQCCKQSETRLNVDHIKPRKKFPDLALDINNLQVLCANCNAGKGNWDRTDWR